MASWMTEGIGADISGLLGVGGMTNPYLAGAKIGLDVYARIQRNKAMMEEARNKAGHLRRKGEAVERQAGKQAADVREEELFKATEEAEELRNTGFLTGSESLSGGTGVSSVFAANKKAAEELSQDILKEASLQAREYDRAAAETEKAAKERTKPTDPIGLVASIFE